MRNLLIVSALMSLVELFSFFIPRVIINKLAYDRISDAGITICDNFIALSAT